MQRLQWRRRTVAHCCRLGGEDGNYCRFFGGVSLGAAVYADERFSAAERSRPLELVRRMSVSTREPYLSARIGTRDIVSISCNTIGSILIETQYPSLFTRLVKDSRVSRDPSDLVEIS